jgi:predicted nucleic acid-binding Zn ribbon protein
LEEVYVHDPPDTVPFGPASDSSGSISLRSEDAHPSLSYAFSSSGFQVCKYGDKHHVIPLDPITVDIIMSRIVPIPHRVPEKSMGFIEFLNILYLTDSMRYNYVPIFPILWAAYCAFNILSNYEYYMRTSEGRLLLALFAVMMILCALLALYLIRPKFLLKAINRISPGRHCQTCSARLEKGSHFCVKCGAIVDGSIECTAMEKCIRCGTKITDVTQEFCPRCGNMLKKRL